MDNEIEDTGRPEGEEVPVCLKCFQPVDPLVHYCPNCGQATGNFTHYLPYENIRWQTGVWGQTWRQIQSPDVSIPGRLLRLVMVIVNVPIMLIGLLFRPNSREGEERSGHSD